MTVSPPTTEFLASTPATDLAARELWRRRVDETPDRPWLWFEGRRWTFGEFDVEMRRVAAGLRDLGVAPGERVLLGLKNRPEAVLLQLAVLQLGAVCVPLVPDMPLGELAFPIEHSEARLLIADDPIATLVLDHRDELPSIEEVVVLLDDREPPAAPDVRRFEDVVAAQPLDHEPLEDYDDQSPSHVLYTSGSTGRPKGVILKAGSLHACGLGYADLYQITGEDTYICATPLAHALGAVASLGIPMVTGGRLALLERFRPTRFWQQVDDSGATVSVLFATHLNLLLEVDDGTRPPGGAFRFVITHIDHPRFRERFGVLMATVWGMSETCVCVGSDPGYRGELGPGYIGRPFPGAETAVFEPGTPNRLPPYERGELALRHPQVMLGYLKDPEATAGTLVDGWIRSSDQAYMDRSGRAFFVGRFKAMIKRSGENVSAEEVEAALLAHPAVVESIVLGVPDPMRSEEVAAIVVALPGAEPDPAELRRFCAERLARWKLPRYFVVREEPLLRRPNLKIDRLGTEKQFNVEAAWDAEAQRRS